MTGRTVVVRLNKQQLQLLDRSVVELSASDRADVLRRALRGFHQRESAPSTQPKPAQSTGGTGAPVGGDQ